MILLFFFVSVIYIFFEAFTDFFKYLPGTCNVVGDSLVKDLVKTVMELKQQFEIVTSTVNTLANQKTIIDGSCCDLPNQVKLPVKTFKEMDELEELLQVATTQQAMVRMTLSIYFIFFAFNFNVNVLLA